MNQTDARSAIDARNAEAAAANAKLNPIIRRARLCSPAIQDDIDDLLVMIGDLVRERDDLRAEVARLTESVA